VYILSLDYLLPSKRVIFVMPIQIFSFCSNRNRVARILIWRRGWIFDAFRRGLTRIPHKFVMLQMTWPLIVCIYYVYVRDVTFYVFATTFIDTNILQFYYKLWLHLTQYDHKKQKTFF